MKKCHGHKVIRLQRIIFQLHSYRTFTEKLNNSKLTNQIHVTKMKKIGAEIKNGLLNIV